jgi:DNA polymerase I-like protein with 3'-5' exonuclease and polymerase domains
MATLSTLPEWLQMEHEVAQLLTNQEHYGWRFNERAAWELESALREELQQIEAALRGRFPFVPGAEFNPKRDNSTSGYVKGAQFTRLKDFNPGSRDHIAFILSNYYQWKPTKLTPTGKPIIDEVVLKEIGSEVSMMFLRLMTITKQLGFLSSGVNAWLKLVTNDRIHHHCSVATVSHRCAHRSPNLGQVPSDSTFRKLFTATPGQVMVGADLSGIELRMLGHYLSRYDGGRYCDILLNGDIHQVNADAMGVSRREVKTISYAMLYGAGPLKIGLTYDDQLSETKAKKKGAELQEAFISAIDGYGSLLDAVKKAAERGYIKAIDGRQIEVASPHKALNALLQSSSAVIAKRWMLINQETINSTNISARQLAFIHDELQFDCSKEHAEQLSTSLVFSAAAAGEYYNLRVPIGAEAKIGRDWSEVH